MNRLILFFAVCVVASTGMRASLADVSEDIERELRDEGISLADNGVDVSVAIDGDGMVLLLISRSSGEVLARQFVDGLPAEPEAVIAHLTIVVASMFKRTENALSSDEPQADRERRSTAPGATNLTHSNEPVARQPSVPPWVIGVSAGRGAGLFLAGETEQVRSSINCCVAFDSGAFRIAVGRRLERRWVASLAVRLGLSGGNRPGHATTAFAGLVRFTFAPRASMSGFTFHAETGIGLVRSDVRLDDQPADMNVDTHASGPALVGGGGRWATSLGSAAQLYIESTLLAGLPLFELSGANSHTALHVDFAVGLALGL